MAVIIGVSKNITAFLDMIAHSEGTDNGRQRTNDHGYDVIVGGQIFTGYRDHPRKLVTLNKLGIKSTAAGRYQLLSRYFDAYRNQLGLKDFSPLSQDLIALQQIKECRAISHVERGEFVRAITKVKNIWASLPGAGYGQHENKLVDLAAVYQRKGGVLA